MSSNVYLSVNIVFLFFFKHKTAYEMRISDWSSDVCSSDLERPTEPRLTMTILPSQRQLMLPILDAVPRAGGQASTSEIREAVADQLGLDQDTRSARAQIGGQDHNLLVHRIRWGQQHNRLAGLIACDDGTWRLRTEEHTSE